MFWVGVKKTHLLDDAGQQLTLLCDDALLPLSESRSLSFLASFG